MKSDESTGRQLVPVRSRSESEFLPAALEIVETPPSPVGRIVALTIIAFFALAVGWATLGQVDIIATAPGRVMPVGRVKVIQPLEAGIIRAIHVRDGDKLKTGDLLIELDPTVAGADRDRLTHDLRQYELEAAQFGALKRAIDLGSDLPEFSAPADAPVREAEVARAATLARAKEQAAKLASFEQQVSAKQAELDETGAVVEKLNATIPLLEEKENLRRQLTEVQLGSRFAYLDAQQARLDAVHEREVQKRRAVEIVAAQKALEQQRDQAKSTYAVDVLARLAEAQQKVSELTQEVLKAEQKASETELRSPIDGTVQQLAVHTVGGVVTPAQPLMVVVPKDQDLIVEAMVSNSDVGFVHAGQDVELKVETFTFTRYGLLHGKVVDVSQDVVTPGDPKRPGDESSTRDQGQSASPAYAAHIRLDQDALMVDGQMQSLSPGMAVTAEIKTGKRTIIEFLLSPLVRHIDESLQER